jgi:hypothetical protein
MDRKLAKDVVQLLWMADKNLHDAFELVYTSKNAEELQDLQVQITGTMSRIYEGIIRPLYDRFPDLRPTKD